MPCGNLMSQHCYNLQLYIIYKIIHRWFECVFAVVVIEFVSTPRRVSKMASTCDGTKVFGRERGTGPKGRFADDEGERAGGGDEALSTKTSDSRRHHHDHRRRRRSPRPRPTNF